MINPDNSTTMIKKVCLINASVVCLFTASCKTSDEPSSQHPNILIIYADDLGYGDVQSYNPDRGKIPTPNIDRLAEQGMRFTDAHSSSAVCSPSRYTILTGRYHWRSRLQRGNVPPFGPPLITPDRLTIGGLVKQKSYHTACIGKWHLGWDWPIPEGKTEMFAPSQKDVTASDEHREIWKEVFSQSIPGGPTAVGFDEYFGTAVPNWPPFCFIENDRTLGIPSEFGAANLFGRNQASRQGPSLKDWRLEDVLPALGDRAVEFIERMADAPEPFLLYFSLTSPHTPLAVNNKWQDKSGISMYADLVMETDWVIGQVLEALEKSGASNNTLVIFASDNGCASYVGNTTPEEAADTTYNDWSHYSPRNMNQLSDLPVKAMEEIGHFPSGPLRGYKSDVWEGGHRVPFIVRWPGKIEPGSISNQLVHQADLMRTIAEVIGVSLPPDAGEDSFSLLPLFYGEENPVREHAVSTSMGGTPGLRTGSWKLILGEGSGRGGWTPGSDGKPIQLYDLENDLGETDNLVDEFPERVEEMRLTMEKLISEGRSTPGPKQENDVEVIRY